MTGKFTLGKTERLKSRKEIEQLFNRGQNFALSPFKIFYEIKNSRGGSSFLSPVKFGVGVSSKNFKRAVDRNRIKRFTREAYRLQKLPLMQKLNDLGISVSLFFIFTAKELPDYQTLYKKLGVILDKLIVRIDENSSQDT